ncbi:hypothetical protein [Streptomyces bicolor]|uniref:hypothetical protein n=1 Tax=Streptomyces bicolor TaxID=66874 RepID=UPI0004E14E05|nr:hypothetical protein [Streptomyces bicolor]
MITTLIHFDAEFANGNRVTTLPVVAWSAEGYALVVDGPAGRLVEARSLPGFMGVSESLYRSTKGASGGPEFKGGR